MDKYITLIGEEHRTALNSLWAVLRQERFEPDELLIFLEGEEEFSDEFEEDFQALLKNYDIDCSIESSPFSEIQHVRHLVEGSEDGKDNLVALDISAAPKIITAEVLLDKGREIFDHVFYLKLENHEDNMNPLPTIERNKVGLKDLTSRKTEAN